MKIILVSNCYTGCYIQSWHTCNVTCKAVLTSGCCLKKSMTGSSSDSSEWLTGVAELLDSVTGGVSEGEAPLCLACLNFLSWNNVGIDIYWPDITWRMTCRDIFFRYLFLGRPQLFLSAGLCSSWISSHFEGLFCQVEGVEGKKFKIKKKNWFWQDVTCCVGKIFRHTHYTQMAYTA